MTSQLFLNPKFKNIEKTLQKFFNTNDSIQLIPLKGGGNNQVFLIEQDENNFVLKNYYHDSFSKRSRLLSEYQFLKYAWDMGIKNIPKPISKFEAKNIAIYSYINGRQPTKSDIDIDEAIKFLLQLNAPSKAQNTLPSAAEACFCYQDYLSTIDRKLSTLMLAAKKSNKEELLYFLINLFLPKWKKMKDYFLKKYKEELNQKFPDDELCITPSDFGFHNAIIKQEKVHFIDFEYAGHDDLVKTICDFFCQPKYPVSLRHLTYFVSSLLKQVTDPAHCVRRVKELMPICQMKWCCIILNIFLSDGKKRRSFSFSNQQEQHQLNKASKYLNNIQEEFSWPI